MRGRIRYVGADALRCHAFLKEVRKVATSVLNKACFSNVKSDDVTSFEDLPGKL